MADTYLPPFGRAMRRGRAAGVMCSYNAVNGAPACTGGLILDVARRTWGFEGYAVSDTVRRGGERRGEERGGPSATC